MSNLFSKKDWEMHSGDTSDFKIECDALTDNDLETLAYLISKKFTLSGVQGIPRGGTKLANKLEKYVDKRAGEQFLIIDDVFTTGASMEQARRTVYYHHLYFNQYRDKIIGVVIFARGKCPNWIRPIFDMSEWLNEKN